MNPNSPSCRTCKHAKYFTNSHEEIHCAKHDGLYSVGSWCHDYITRVDSVIEQISCVLKEGSGTGTTIANIAKILNIPGNRCFVGEYAEIEEYLKEHITIKREI